MHNRIPLHYDLREKTFAQALMFSVSNIIKSVYTKGKVYYFNYRSYLYTEILKRIRSKGCI